MSINTTRSTSNRFIHPQTTVPYISKYLKTWRGEFMTLFWTAHFLKSYLIITAQSPNHRNPEWESLLHKSNNFLSQTFQQIVIRIVMEFHTTKTRCFTSRVLAEVKTQYDA